MRILPNSLGFTLLLGTLAALPPLAIEMGLPALALVPSARLKIQITQLSKLAPMERLGEPLDIARVVSGVAE